MVLAGRLIPLKCYVEHFLAGVWFFCVVVCVEPDSGACPREVKLL